MDDLPRRERLRGSERIGQLFEAGIRGAAGKVAARILPNPEGETRVAVAAGRKLAKAVKRNRMKRRLRAAFRTQKDALPKGCDVVLLAKAGVLEAKWPELKQDVAKAMTRAAGALRSETGAARTPAAAAETTAVAARTDAGAVRTGAEAERRR